MQKEKYSKIFDGRIYGILLESLVAESVTTIFAKKAGIDISQVINKYTNGKVLFLIKSDELLKGGEIIIEKIINENFLEKDKQEILHETEKIDVLSKEISRHDFTQLKNEELIILFKRFATNFKEFYGKVFTPIFLEYGESILSKKCEEILKDKTGKDKFAEYFTILLTPSEGSIIAKEELEFNKLAHAMLSREFEKIKKSETFKSHVKKWNWITFDILSKTGWNEEEYTKRFEELIGFNTIKEKIEKEKSRSFEILKKQEEIISSLDLTIDEKKVIEATRVYGSLKEYRKNMIVLIWYRLVPLLDEIAIRAGSDKEKIQFMLVDEIEKVFENYNDNLIEERIKNSVMLTENGVSEILIGKECDKFFKDMIFEKPDNNAKELKGMTAYAGFAKGKAKIINSLNEASKMNEGDILISEATFPELVPIMKKAAAIVTDDGGITCHAAIVARELHIPCVIGTKFATRIIKDDDEIQVDASNGLVTFLNKYEKKDSKEETEKTETKLVIFDAYGVTLKGGYPETCKKLGELFNRDWKELYNLFYKKWFNLAAEKKISQKEAWEKAIEESGIPITLENIKEIHYGFMKINDNMAKFAEDIGKNTNTLLLSKNTGEQFLECNEKLAFTKYFKNTINTWDINLPKASKETCEYIFKEFNIKPEEIIYIDDQEENLLEAKKLGVKTILFKHELFEDFKKEFYTHYNSDEWQLLSSRQRISPFPNYYSMECITYEMKNHLGIAYNKLMMLFKNNLMHVSVGKKDYERVSKHAINAILNNPKFFHKIVDYIKKEGEEFVNELRLISEKNTALYTNEELGRFQELYEKKYKNIYSRYFTLLTVEKRLGEYLKDYLKNKNLSDEDAEKYFSELINEPRAQVNAQERYAALNLAVKIWKNKIWKSYFLKKDTLKLVKKDKELDLLLRNHEKSFFWITRDYDDTVLTYSDFVDRINELLKNNPEKALIEQENLLNNIEKIKSIEKQFSIDSRYSLLFESLREGIHLKELRKSIVSQSLHYYDSILKEISKRSGITINEARHLKTDEIKRVFNDKKLQEEAKERVILSAFIVENNFTRIYTKEKAEELYKQHVEVNTNVKEFKGIISSPGKTQGIAKIVMHPNEVSKVQKGDVIVSVQIVPSFAPAIKKAAGIVCDGGTGITSHPAILAREAKIPCITGAKIATRAIKDGDLIEVDANTGIVRILENTDTKEIWRHNFEIKKSDYQMVCEAFEGMYLQKATISKICIKKSLAIFENGDNTGGYFKKNELRELIDNTLKVFLNYPIKIKRIHEKTIKYNHQYFKALKEVENKKLQNLSKKEMIQMFFKLYNLKKISHGYSMPTTWFIDSDGEDLSNSLIGILNKKISEYRIKTNAAEAFSTLTTPENYSLAQIEGMEGLRIIDKILKDKITKEWILKENTETTLDKINTKIRDAIITHYNKWLWTPYGYIGPAYELSHYLNNWKEMIESGINPEKELSNLEKIRKDTESLKKRLRKEFRLSPLENKYFENAEDIIWLKSFRKDVFFYGCFITDKLLEELGKSVGFSRMQMKYVAPQEMNRFDKLTAQELNERMKSSIMYADNGKIKIMTGDKAKSFLEKQKFEKIEIKDINELKGSCACPGKASGNVKIINQTEDMHKMNKGDIMIAHTTFPSLVPAMKKAAAIVTDDGGITCHAAIVARELRIPCVVGTRIATKVLKDGDLVEVDAETGVIKKIENIYKIENNQYDNMSKNKQESENIIWLKDANINSLSLVGGKGANLGEMFKNFPIPNGFCITVNAYDLFLKENKLKEKINVLLKNLDVEDTKKLETTAKNIRKIITDAKIPNELASEIKTNYKTLENKKVAVRSSATAEDLPNASFAGQQDTYLNMEGEDKIIDSVKRCFASLFTSRAIYYREKNNFKNEDVKISVVIQEMVDAKYAGVMFTLDPIHKKYSLVEAVEGLGEKLVSGQVTPNTYFLDRKTQKIGETNIVFEMDESIIKEVSKIGETIEKHYKQPMDVEWVYNHKKQIKIVQARPITT